MKNKILSITILLALSGNALAAEQSGAAFLRIDPSPRAYALGGAGSVMAFGAQAIGANPANLGAAKYKYEMFSSFSNLVNHEQYAHAAFAINRSTERRHFIEGLGISVTQLSVSDAEGRDRAGAKTHSFGSSDRAVSLTASSLLGEKLRAGITGKIIQSELAGYRSGASLAGDFGINYDLSRDKIPLSLGLALRNMGPGIRYINQTNPLPSSIDAGLGLGVGRATFIAEINQMLSDRKTNFSTGMEFGFGPLSLRAGLNSLASQTAGRSAASPIVQNFSYGIGLKLGAMKFDYALSSQVGDFGLTHRASLTLCWGAPLNRPRPKIYDISQSK